MKKLLKSIDVAIAEYARAVKDLTSLKRALVKKKAPVPKPKSSSKALNVPSVKPAPQLSPAAKRQRVIDLLIWLLRRHKIFAAVGAGNVYANDPIGFNNLSMVSYLADCKKTFGKWTTGGASRSLSIGGLADLIIANGGNP